MKRSSSNRSRRNPANPKSGNKNVGTLPMNPGGPGHSSHRGRKSGGGIVPPPIHHSTGTTPMEDLGIPPTVPGDHEGFKPVFKVGGDLTEFPSLPTGNFRKMSNQNRPSKIPISMTRKLPSKRSSFAMTMDDFPPLRDNGLMGEPRNEGSKVQFQSPDASLPIGPKISNQTEDSASKLGIQYSTMPDGRVTNIPQSMLNDQFGIAGLLAGMRIVDADPHLGLLSHGTDLTRKEMRLDLIDRGTGTLSFAGPLGLCPIGVEDIHIECPALEEYRMSTLNLRGKLAPLKMSMYQDDLLFYIFYTCTGDLLQILAAEELFNRHWRYHMERQIWVTNAQGVRRVERGPAAVKDVYLFFDPNIFRKVQSEFVLDCNKLEGRPYVPRNLF